MKKKKLDILFVQLSFPSQFGSLFKYLNRSGLANAYTLCGENHRRENQFDFSNLFSFTPHGDISRNSYYYSGKVEKSTRISLGALTEIKRLSEKIPIDLIVAHGTLGSPHLFFDEVDAPIITYMEFPSFRLHGWDEKYPPADMQRYADKNFEMLSFYQVMKSDLVITPSDYAKSLLPKELSHKIFPQMEGFDSEKLKIAGDTLKFRKEKGTTYIGYCSRLLSSEKGFEQFIRISKAITAKRKNIKFVVMGDSTGMTYGFEKNLLDRKFGPGKMTFKDYVLAKENVDRNNYIFIDKMDYADFASTVNQVDLFLYPLQFGSANWGIYELLLRNKIVIASDRCFIPEIIDHGRNGLLCDYINIDSWVNTTLETLDNPELRKSIESNLDIGKSDYYINNVAPKYLDIFERAIVEYKKKKDSEYAEDTVKVAKKAIEIGAIQKRYELAGLIDMVKSEDPKVIVEIGTAKGGTLFSWLKISDENSTIVSIDLPFEGAYRGGYKKTDTDLFRSFAKEGHHLHFLTEDSHEVSTFNKLKGILDGKSVDFLFIDGDHSYEGVKRDWELYSPLVRKNGLIGVHDIISNPKRPNNKVYKFWEEIKHGENYREFVDQTNDIKWGGIGVVYKA